MKTSFESQARKIIRRVLRKHKISGPIANSYNKELPLRIETSAGQNIRIVINTETVCEDPFEGLEIISEITEALEKEFKLETQFLYDFYFIDLYAQKF